MSHPLLPGFPSPGLQLDRNHNYLFNKTQNQPLHLCPSLIAANQSKPRAIVLRRIEKQSISTRTPISLSLASFELITVKGLADRHTPCPSDHRVYPVICHFLLYAMNFLNLGLPTTQRTTDSLPLSKPARYCNLRDEPTPSLQLIPVSSPLHGGL